MRTQSADCCTCIRPIQIYVCAQVHACEYLNSPPYLPIYYNHIFCNNLLAKDFFLYQRPFAELAGQLQEIIFICTMIRLFWHVLFTVHYLPKFGAKFCSIREMLEILFSPFLQLIYACYCLVVSGKTAK